MKTAAKTILFFLSAYVFFAPFLVSAGGATQTCRSDVKGYCVVSSPEKNTLNNPGIKNKEFAAEDFVVPGLEFLKIPANAELGDILIKIYTYLFSLVGISALVMVIWGGINYAMATEGGAKEARQRISNAFIGLGIALLAYLGLITINPDFVKKLNLKLHDITMSPINNSTCIQGSACMDPRGGKDANGKSCTGKSVCNQDGSFGSCEVDRSGGNCAPPNPSVCKVAFYCNDDDPNHQRTEYANKFFQNQDQCNASCNGGIAGDSSILNAIGRTCGGGEAVNFTIDSSKTGCGGENKP